MPTNIGANMDHKEIILKYMKEKNNEDDYELDEEVITAYALRMTHDALRYLRGRIAQLVRVLP